MRRLKQFFHKLSIRKKMLTILCLVGMLPVLVLGISLGINSYRTVLKYREKDMTNTLQQACGIVAVSYTHLRAHETDSYLVCRLLLEKKKTMTRCCQQE